MLKTKKHTQSISLAYSRDRELNRGPTNFTVCTPQHPFHSFYRLSLCRSVWSHGFSPSRSDRNSTHSSDEVSVVASFHQTSRRLRKYVTLQPMKDCLISLSNETHTLNNLLPRLSAASQHYNLRQSRHNLELPNKTVHLTHNNFIQRMLYLDPY